MHAVTENRDPEIYLVTLIHLIDEMCTPEAGDQNKSNSGSQQQSDTVNIVVSWTLGK